MQAIDGGNNSGAQGTLELKDMNNVIITENEIVTKYVQEVRENLTYSDFDIQTMSSRYFSYESVSL